MNMKHFFSSNYGIKNSNASIYLVVTGIALTASVLPISNAYARGIAPVEVFVYEGEPIDYSNRDDVIVIYDSSYQEHYAEAILTKNAVSNLAKQPDSKTNTAATSRQAPQQTVRKTKATQPKALAVANIKPIIEVKLSKPIDKPIKLEKEDPKLVAFYANVMEMQKRKKLTLARASIAKTVRQKTTKKPKINEIQLASKDLEAKVINPSPNKTLAINTKGKDPELLAFYMDVFVKKNSNLSNQSIKPLTVVAKQVTIKNIVKKKRVKKNKTREVQLALKSSEGKDPELVAFYKQVFANDKAKLTQRAPVVANVKLKSKSKTKIKAKDPELVAFYEREFGKNSIHKNKNKKTPVIAKTKINKTKKMASSKSSKNEMAKKAVSKVQQKTVGVISSELAELQELIDDLTAKNII